MATITTTEVPYGSNFLQRVDLLEPDGVIKGVVIWIHGGGWAGGAKSAIGFTSGQAAFTNNDDSDIRIVANAGYVVVNCAYRLTSPASDGYGGDRTGGYPNAITDIETILDYCMVRGATLPGTAAQTIYNYVTTYGLIVAGASAGGHLAVQAVGKFGTSSGKWPKAVINLCGPMDIVYNNTDLIIPPALQTAVNLFSDPSDITGSTKNTNNLIAASPRYQYGTSASPGPWYSALNASNCKFYFIQNTNDTLVTSAMVTPFINSLPPSKVVSSTVTEGTATPGVLSHNFTTPASTFVINIANSELPISMSTSLFPPSSYVSFVAVTDGGTGYDWYISEGLYTATVTLTTSGIPAGTVLYWTTLSSVGTLTTGDFTDGQIQGTVTIGSNGTATIIRNARADLTTEGSELFRLEIRETSYTSPVMITSTSSVNGNFIGIGDSSTTPATITYVSLVGVSDNSSSNTTINEGQYTATFTLTTTSAQDGTVVYWTTLGSTIAADDFTDGLLQGTATITGNKAYITRTARADLTTEGSDIFRLEVRETSYTSQVKVTSGPITIADTSLTPSAPASTTYDSFVGVTDISAGGTTIYEGQYTATFTLTTTNGAGKTVYWTTVGSAYGTMTTDDFSDGQLQGTVLIGSNGVATITRTARADLFTDGIEVFSLEIRETSYTSTVKITSSPIGIADTSQTPVTTFTMVSFVGVTTLPGLDWGINEGQYTATFTLTTSNVPNGTVFYWTTLAVVGTITADDFTDNALQGTATITGNTATIIRAARADSFTESSELFKLEIRETSYTSPVLITSTSSSSSGSIGILDTSTNPTYAVAAAAGATSVDEGVALTFNVTTTNVPNGTTLYWNYNGGSAAEFDLTALSGSFTINSFGQGTFTVTPIADTTTEGTETFSVGVRTVSTTGVEVAVSGTITINDTSTTPVATPTYSVAAAAGATSVNEGVALTFNVTTTNVANNSVLNWAVSNAGDFATSSGTVTIATTGVNGTGTFTVTPTADSTTENTPETFTASVYTGSIAGTPVATSSSITINDTSQTPVSAITYVSLVGVTSSVSGITLFEDGQSPATFTLTTTNAPDGTVVYWTTLGSVSYPLITAADFTDNTLQGTATITGNKATIIRTARADFFTEGTELFYLEIREASYTSPVKITSDPFGIADTSVTITATITPTTLSVDEGSSLLCSVTTVGATDGTTLYWSVSRPSDFTVSSGSFTVTSNQGSFSVIPTADQSTEVAAETFTISVLSGPVDGSISPTVYATSDSITINDTSKTRTYSIIPVATSVNEGTAVRFNITTVNVPSGTQLFWSVSNSGDFSTSAGTVTIQSDTANFSVTPTLDYVAETPAETFTASISLTSGGIPVATSNSVTINDIAGLPVYTITPAASSVSEGSPLTFTITTTNVPANTVLYWTVTPPVAVAPPPTPVYIITPAANSVNEGSSLTFNVSGSDIPPGTHYWTIGTNSGDFGVTSGSFTITGNTGSFNVTPLADTATEGAETFTVSVRTGSITGTPVVTTNPAITINDTSQAPIVPTYAVSTTPTSVNEGVAITFTVTTTNVTDGTVLNWAVTNAGDFAISSGTVTINSSTGTFSVTPRADAATEAIAETFTASVYTGSIVGLPVATSSQITINDTSQTPPSATYAIATSPSGVTSVNEGTSITFNVTTTNIPNGTTLNWATNNLSPSSNADFTASNGVVLISNNTGTFTVTPVADATTETVIEKFTVSIYAGSISGTPVVTSDQITINDTSQTPPPPTYAVAPAANSVNEGSPLTFNVTTTNVANGTTLYWVVLTNDGDFATSNGTVIINSNTGSFSVIPTADATTEVAAETFTVGIRTSALSVFNEATSSTVTIVDTSQTPPPGPTYAVAPAASSIDEGSPLTFNVTTTNVPNGTTLYWAYKTGSADVADITAASGSFTINNLGQGTFTVTPIADTTTEGPQTFSVGVRTGSITGPEEAVSVSVIINDTSLTPVPPESATYSVAAASSFVDEGSPITFTVTTTNILANTILYWSVDNVGDFGTSSGTVTINNLGQGTFTVTPIADLTTEGPETFRATIRSVSSSGDVEAISGLVTITDTSQAPPSPNPPTYSVTPSASTVDEGSPLAFTVTTTNVAENTILSWLITNPGDFGISTGFVTINGNTGTFSVTPALDLITEGVETFTASIYTGSITGNPVATSTSVSIIDTSQGPGVPLIPEYFIIPAALSVNEGTPLIITVNTLNVDNNTRLYWSVTNAGDFATSSGSVLIISNTGSFSVTPTQDSVVELAETFIITIRTDSPTGDPVVTSNPITINATVSQSQFLNEKITPAVYNNARTQVAGVLGVTTTGQVGATQGYGQALSSSAVSQHEKITEAHLDNLRLDLVKTRIHQSDVDPNLVNVAVSNIALADVFDSYSVLATTCNTLKDQIGPNQLASTSYTQTATYSAYTGTPNTGGGWKNYAFYELTVTFATADAARYFFNAGSSFKFAASRTGGTIAPTVGLNQNTSWTNLLLGVTADNPTFAKNDFYALSNTYSTVYNKNSAGIYSANYYRIAAKTDVVDNSYGGATVVTFKIEFVDAFNDGNSSNYDGVDGIFESVVVRNMPKGMGLGGSISVAAPTSVIPTPSNAFTVDGTPIYITAAYQIAATPTSVSEAGATINFTFTATNYNVPNTVTWFITATTQTGLSDFIETGWTSATNVDGYKQLIKATALAPASTFAASFTTASIITNPDSLTEGTETFTVTAVPAADGSGGGIASDPVTITVTDSSKTPTPGYQWSAPPPPAPNLSCIPGEGLGDFGLWVISSIALTGAAPLVIYGIYLDISSNSNINSYKMTLWDDTILTETTTTFYTLPTPKSVANGGNVQFRVQVGSTSGTAGTGTVNIRVRTNAGTVDGSGPNIIGPSYNSAAQPVSVQVVAPAPALSITANPPSVSYNYISGSTNSATTQVTVTNTGNARATLSNYNVSNPGGGSVNAGSISGLILAGGTKSTTVTYSTSSAYSGTSNISITGLNDLTGTISANRNVAVTAVQAFGIISQSISGTTSSVVYAQQTFNINVSNSGLAPLTVSLIQATFTPAGPITFSQATSYGFPFTIPAGGSQTFSFNWSRNRIGPSTLAVTITSNTGGNAGTITTTSTTVTASALTPTASSSSSNGQVVAGSFNTRGVLKKVSYIRIVIENAQPSSTIYQAATWEWGATHNGTTPKAALDALMGPVGVSSTGFAVMWPGDADPQETRSWYTGVGKIWMRIPNGIFDNGTQSYYIHPGRGGDGSNQDVTQTYIEVEIVPNMIQAIALDKDELSNLDPGTNATTNPRYTWTMIGGPNNGIMAYTNFGTGTFNSAFDPVIGQSSLAQGTGETQLNALGEATMGNSAEWVFGPLRLNRQFTVTYVSAASAYNNTRYDSNVVTATVYSPAYYATGGSPPLPFPGPLFNEACWVVPVSDNPATIGIWYKFWRTVQLTRGSTYNVYAYADDDMYCAAEIPTDFSAFRANYFDSAELRTSIRATFVATSSVMRLAWVVYNDPAYGLGAGNGGTFMIAITTSNGTKIWGTNQYTARGY